MADSAPSSVSRLGNLLEGKRGVIMGAANNRSLGWGIAEACAAQGAELAFTYQGEALERRVRPLAVSIGSDHLVQCDVGDEASIDAAFQSIGERWDQIDFLVHAIAYADKAYCAAVMSIRRAPLSCRRWTSPATRCSLSRSVLCR